MARPESRESAADEAWGWQEIQRLLDELDALPDHSEIAVRDGSTFDIDNQIENYDPPSDQVLFLIGVATDHLETFKRMLQDPNGGLPAMAGYTLLRAAIEAAGTAIWLRCGGTVNSRISRSLWLISNAREEVQTLSARLGLQNPEGYDRMRARLDGIIAGRRGLQPSVLARRHTKTSILNVVNGKVRSRYLTPLEAWQACSGITHSNRSSALMFLEREQVGVVGTRATYNVTASARVTAEVLWIAMACLTEASRVYVSQSER